METKGSNCVDVAAVMFKYVRNDSKKALRGYGYMRERLLLHPPSRPVCGPDWPVLESRIRLVGMDMWKAFRTSVQTHAPQAQVLFDRFHILRHSANAMDEVRRIEYKRVAAKDRSFIKGQRYTLLSHRAHLTLAGRRLLQKLLRANKRLAIVYLLKEEFGQLWSYRRESWARQCLTRWREQLKWQRLRPFEQFAALIERHWDGIAAYSEPRNKVKLGFVEGLNHKIRMIQQRVSCLSG